MRRSSVILIAIFILDACSAHPALPASTSTPLPASTLTPFATATPTPVNTPTLAPSPIVVAIQYHDPVFNLTFEYPLSWTHVRDLEFQGPDGFLRITKLGDYYGKSVFHLCDDYVLRTFPSDLSAMVQIPLGSGCLIYLKSPKLQDPVTWIFRYRYTLHDSDFLLLQTNYGYFQTFIETGRFRYDLPEKYHLSQPIPHPRQIGRPPGITIQEYFAGNVRSDGHGNFNGIDLNQRSQYYVDQDPTPKCGKYLVIQNDVFSLDEGGGLINVKKGNQILYAAPAVGPGGVAQSFCEWNGHWVLETQEFVFIDGQNMNHELNYDEIFGWRLVNGKPFFFYRQNGFVHLSFDGHTLPIAYDNVPHDGCCEAGTAQDPRGNDSLVWFYGMRQSAWYYTEIRFNQ